MREARPLVLRGLVSNWPAVAAARAGAASLGEYLRRFDARKPVPTLTGGPEIAGRLFYRDDMRGLNFTRAPMQIGAIIESLLRHLDDPHPPAISMQSTPAAEAFPGFERDNPMPLLEGRAAPRLWLGNKVEVAPHIDLNENIACVVAGRRRFILFPPDQLPNLYVGPFDFSPAGAPVSMVPPSAPDFERWPRYRKALAAAQVAELEPGDAIFIPYMWWHGVQSLGPINLLVNYWWNEAKPAGSPYDVLMHAMLVLSRLPEAHRAAWRAMFDTYVFSAQGDPLAHLPQHARGALGGLDEQGMAQMRAYLAQALGRG